MQQPINRLEGSTFRLNQFMSKTHFMEITSCICFTNKNLPKDFVDEFHEVHKMLGAFNNHYDHNYVVSRLSCLNESMRSWLIKFSPEFLCVPRKPHPFRNEYHTITDSNQGELIMFWIKLVEGKDRPKEVDGLWALPLELDHL